jgi:hypothetical protein
VFGIEIERCSGCGGRLKVIASSGYGEVAYARPRMWFTSFVKDF